MERGNVAEVEVARSRALAAEVALVALTIAVGMQLVRVAIPSLQYLLYSRLRVPAAVALLAGAVLFASGAAFPALARAMGLRATLYCAAGATSACRLALQLWAGDPVVDMVLALVGVAAFLVTMPALLAVARAGAPSPGGAEPRFVAGLLLGIAVDTALHGAFLTYDHAWQSGLVPILVAAAMSLAQFAALSSCRRDMGDGPEPAGAFAWGTVGAALFVELAAFQNVARATALSGLAFPEVFAIAMAGQVVGVLAALWAHRLPAHAWWAAGVLIASLVPSTEPGVMLLGLVAGQGALGVLLARVAAAGGPAVPVRRSDYAKTGLVLGALVGAQFARQGVPLAVSADWVLVLAALGIVAVASTASGGSSPVRSPRAAVTATVLLTLCAPAGVALWWREPSAFEVALDRPVRVVSYNIHKGFAPSGRLDLEGLALTIEGLEPDVVALQEVSRGQITDGRVDMATVLSQRLGLPFRFAPTGARLWGQATMTSIPIRRAASALLPPVDLPTPRSYGLVELDVGAEPLLVLNTHYSPSFGTAVRVAHTGPLVALLGERGARRTVVAGDLNAPPGEPAMRALFDAGLIDAVDGAGLVSGHTAPSWRPSVRIDYVLHTPDLTASEVAIAESAQSDHLPVAATLSQRPRAGE